MTDHLDRAHQAAPSPSAVASAGASRTAGTGPRLRIAMVAPAVVRIPPERYAGTERIVTVLASGLMARGHHVTLFASGDSTAGSEVVPVIPRAAWTQGWAGDNAALSLLSAMTALEAAERFDILHAHVDAMSLALARRSPVPVVTTFHSRL